MKEFVVKDFDKFMEIADTINTPFKFYEIKESDAGTDYRFLRASVWMRTAYLTYEVDVKAALLETLTQPLTRHGFTQAFIRETAIPIK